MRLTRLVTILMAAMLGACSSAPRMPPPPEPPPDERPDDFVLAATVLTPPEARLSRLPRSLRPARYIVEPGGMLRASVGPGASTTTYPGETRQLTPREFDALWREVRSSNLLSPGNPARVNDPEAIARSSDRATALIYIGYADHRVTLRIILDRSTPESVTGERLIDDLAELSWIRD
jgi:hypothetical protein